MVAGPLITLAGVTLSDHNRSPLRITLQDYRQNVRLASGLLRSYCLGPNSSNKTLTFNISWDMLPRLDAETWDGKAGKNSLNSLANTYWQTPIVLTYQDINGLKSYNVYISDYSETLVKRYVTSYWNIDLTLEQK